MADQQKNRARETANNGASFSYSRRRPLPMPPDDVLRNSIARSLTQILVNMQNTDTQNKCRELLQLENLTYGAHIKILTALEQIDEQREHAANHRK